MLLRIRIIIVFVCIGVGVASQSVLANPFGSGKNLFSVFRTNNSHSSSNGGQADESSAASHHRLAITHVERNDIDKAHSHFGLALTNAAPKQIPAIAADYAAFLSANGDLHRTELVLRQALTQAPNDKEIIRMLARCLVLQDKIIEGRRYFMSICSEEEARAEIAVIYREQKNTDMLAAMEKRWGATGETTSKPVQSNPVLIAAAPKSFAAVIAPPNSPLTKSEFFDSKVPIPVPNLASQVVVVTASLPTPMPPAASNPRLPAPLPITVKSAAEVPALQNPVKLAGVPIPVLPKTTEASKPAVAPPSGKHTQVQ